MSEPGTRCISVQSQEARVTLQCARCAAYPTLEQFDADQLPSLASSHALAPLGVFEKRLSQTSFLIATPEEGDLANMKAPITLVVTSSSGTHHPIQVS